MSRGNLWLAALIALFVAAAALLYRAGDAPDLTDPLPPFTVDARPVDARYLFDYAGILGHFTEGVEGYLERIRQRYRIEALVVTVPGLGDATSIETLAVDLANGWRLGAADQGRGLLLLLTAPEQQVKLEVGYALEDVFTDAFTGYIEDLQLPGYFQRGDIGTGLVAVMEEIERRAQIKHQQDYTLQTIADMDRQLLSGGAGSQRNLAEYEPEPDGPRSVDAGGGAGTPQEAWETMLAKWAGKGAEIDQNVYTEMTRLAMGDPDRPDKRTRAAVKDWRDTEYQILRENDHAVIWFGNREGWNHAPFLFCRTSRGWQFDIVHQRRLVVMAENPRLLSGAKQSTGKDIALAPEDRYRCREDLQIAAEIRRLEAAYRQSPNVYATAMALARLNVITGRRPNHVTPYLDAAKRLNPDSAEPYRYAAIYHVNAFFQYETALREVRQLLKRRPDDFYGLLLEAFLHYRLGDYRASINSLERALQDDPDNVYALSMMARNYTLLYSKANRLNPLRDGYATSARAMLARAGQAAPPDSYRVEQLAAWMAAWSVL